MNAFHEGYLPLPTTAVRGGPERRTEVVTLGSGREERNAVWAHGRRRYDIGAAVTTIDMLNALIGFFEARRGRLQGFRFRDGADCKSCAPTAAPAATDQALGVGDGACTTFQLQKVYGEGDDSYVRPIRKPVAASTMVAVDGVSLAPGDFAVDATTGIVTMAVAPASGVGVSAGFVFDTPVRFDTDRLEARIDSLATSGAAMVPLIEIVL